MKSKELILAEHIQDEAGKYPTILAAMTEYACQQTAAIAAERDEYRKALETIAANRPNTYSGDVIRDLLAKYPQQ